MAGGPCFLAERHCLVLWQQVEAEAGSGVIRGEVLASSAA